MPATLSDLRRPIFIEHEVDFGDGVTITFRYDRNIFVEGWFEDADARGDLNSVLAEVIESWDLTADDGSGFPPTAANIAAAFTMQQKGWLLGELMTASVPSRAEGNSSSAPTSTPPSDSTEPQPTHQNGRAVSTQPGLSASLSTS